MGETPVKEPANRRRLTESGAVILGAALLTSGAMVALAVPRPVAPTETPSLVLGTALVVEARARDAAQAAEMPSGPLVDTLLDAYQRHGDAEHFGTSQNTFQQDRRAITSAVARLRAEHGDDALITIQANVVERLEDALRGEMEDAERIGFLGSFEQTLARYGLVEDGVWLAPDLVVRTLFKARFNAALRRPLTEGLSPIELEAYWGWLALEAHHMPAARRLEALGEYEDAYGSELPEARGVLLFQAGRGVAAAEAFEQAYAESGSIRLRNHALAAMMEAEGAR